MEKGYKVYMTVEQGCINCNNFTEPGTGVCEVSRDRMFFVLKRNLIVWSANIQLYYHIESSKRFGGLYDYSEIGNSAKKGAFLMQFSGFFVVHLM